MIEISSYNNYGTPMKLSCGKDTNDEMLVIYFRATSYDGSVPPLYFAGNIFDDQQYYCIEL
jgi:hypothetical protein